MADAFEGAALGLRRGVVALSPARAEWVEAYARVHEVLERSAPPSVVAIEHIGSTSVPGLAAKPILDVAVGVDRAIVPGAVLPKVDEWLTDLGLLFRGDADDIRPDRMYGYELEPMVRLANVHVLEHATAPWRHYIGFRDRLRSSAADRDAYAAMKRALAHQHPDDRIAYVEAKGAFIRPRR
ncbi:GrpB family protein [Microbacterium tumbae]